MGTCTCLLALSCLVLIAVLLSLLFGSLGKQKNFKFLNWAIFVGGKISQNMCLASTKEPQLQASSFQNHLAAETKGYHCFSAPVQAGIKCHGTNIARMDQVQ